MYGFQTPDSEEPSAAGVWKGLKENTTAHGIPHINKAKGMDLSICFGERMNKLSALAASAPNFRVPEEITCY